MDCCRIFWNPVLGTCEIFNTNCRAFWNPTIDSCRKVFLCHQQEDQEIHQLPEAFQSKDIFVVQNL